MNPRKQTYRIRPVQQVHVQRRQTMVVVHKRETKRPPREHHEYSDDGYCSLFEGIGGVFLFIAGVILFISGLWLLLIPLAIFAFIGGIFNALSK